MKRLVIVLPFKIHTKALFELFGSFAEESLLLTLLSFFVPGPLDVCSPFLFLCSSTILYFIIILESGLNLVARAETSKALFSSCVYIIILAVMPGFNLRSLFGALII